MNIYRKVINKLNKIKYDNYRKKNILKGYEDLLNSRINSLNNIDGETGCECIICSLDRAMQLHTLLSTYFEKVKNPVKLYILFKASNDRHKRSYIELFKIFSKKNMEIIEETNFRKQIIEILENIKTSKMFFLSDDSLFKKSVDLEDISKFNPYKIEASLVKGLDATYCQNYASEQKLPIFLDNVIDDLDKKCWIWGDADNSPDFSCPTCLLGNIYSTKEILLLTKLTFFKGPNSYEGHMNEYDNIFNRRYGVCYNKAVLGVIPINSVNKEVDNISTNAYSVDELLEMWEKGYQINYEKLYEIEYNDLLKLEKLDFIKR